MIKAISSSFRIAAVALIALHAYNLATFIHAICIAN